MVPAAAQDERQLDERAVRRVAAGDDAAFAELYHRHFAGVFDFATRMLQNRELAGEVVQASFVKALEALRSGKEVARVKPWLYAIARNAAIDELRRRARERSSGSGSEGEDEPSPFARPDPARLADPAIVAADHELADLVWRAATGLSPGDYGMLDMHLRQDLDADEIAEALGLRKGAVYTRLSRMKDALEESVGTLLLIRRGRQDCPELDALVSGPGEGQLSPDVRRAVARHTRRCERCDERRRRFASPTEVLGALSPVPALPGVEDAVWAAVSTSAHVGKVATEPPDPGAEPAGWWHGAGTATRTRVLAAACAAAGLAGALILVSSGGPPATDPDGLRSTSHRVGVPTARATIEMAWSPAEGASGYSIVWSRSRDALPDETADLPGDASGTTERLTPGRWYFVLRTEGEDGEWTATERAGPYVIEERTRPEARRRQGGREGTSDRPEVEDGTFPDPPLERRPGGSDAPPAEPPPGAPEPPPSDPDPSAPDDPQQPPDLPEEPLEQPQTQPQAQTTPRTPP